MCWQCFRASRGWGILGKAQPEIFACPIARSVNDVPDEALLLFVRHLSPETSPLEHVENPSRHSSQGVHGVLDLQLHGSVSCFEGVGHPREGVAWHSFLNGLRKI